VPLDAFEAVFAPVESLDFELLSGLDRILPAKFNRKYYLSLAGDACSHRGKIPSYQDANKRPHSVAASIHLKQKQIHPEESQGGRSFWTGLLVMAPVAR
jgi:hypothetical protein